MPQPSTTIGLPNANYDEAAVGHYTLPDPLRFTDGRTVRTKDEWPRRREEIISLFEEHVFGCSPTDAAGLEVTPVEADDLALDGLAIRRQVTISFGASLPSLHLLVYLPSAAHGAAPLFLGPNFLGNHTIHADPGIRLSDAVFANGMDVALPDGPRETTRGLQADRWPLETILRRGYGLATFFYGDVFPDRSDGRALSIQPLFDSAEYSWGAIATWSFAMSRALDVLLTMPEIDPRRIALVGHSRHGKAALWASALDERFRLVIANNSGKGGASLMRRNFGETIRHLVTRYPHWFAARYADYADRGLDLPVDQHMLIALTAPRPLFIASAAEDLWADPKGERLAAEAAAPVARMMSSTIGYHIRPGGHGVTADDWGRFLDFADGHMS